MNTHTAGITLGATATAFAPMHPDALLTSVELARLLKVSDRAPENWRLQGTGPIFIRAGGRRVLYRWSDVLKYLNGRRFHSTSEECPAELDSKRPEAA